MHYITHYIWESGSDEENPISLALQQVSRKQHHYLLACVCDGRRSVLKEQTGTGSSETQGATVSGYFTERLVEWFHRHYLELVKKKNCEEDITKALTKELQRTRQELQEYGKSKGMEVNYDMVGIFLCDSTFWMFREGECQGYLFNRRFNKKQMRSLPEWNTEASPVLQGQIQKNIAIMLGNASFGKKMTEEEMLQVLFEEDADEETVAKGLRELWREEVCRGSREAAGAIYIRIE